jgi:hypothetical protein
VKLKDGRIKDLLWLTGLAICHKNNNSLGSRSPAGNSATIQELICRHSQRPCGSRSTIEEWCFLEQ